MTDSLIPPSFPARRVGQRRGRPRLLPGRAWRPGLGAQGPGEAGRREPARDEQEAAEHAGGAADQEHAPAEGEEARRSRDLPTLPTLPLPLPLIPGPCLSLQDLELLSQELVRLSKENSPGSVAAGSG